jgi:hypothetical protein
MHTPFLVIPPRRISPWRIVAVAAALIVFSMTFVVAAAFVRCMFSSHIFSKTYYIDQTVIQNRTFTIDIPLGQVQVTSAATEGNVTIVEVSHRSASQEVFDSMQWDVSIPTSSGDGNISFLGTLGTLASQLELTACPSFTVYVTLPANADLKLTNLDINVESGYVSVSNISSISELAVSLNTGNAALSDVTTELRTYVFVGTGDVIVASAWTLGTLQLFVTSGTATLRGFGGTTSSVVVGSGKIMLNIDSRDFQGSFDLRCPVSSSSRSSAPHCAVYIDDWDALSTVSVAAGSSRRHAYGTIGSGSKSITADVTQRGDVYLSCSDAAL